MNIDGIFWDKDRQAYLTYIRYGKNPEFLKKLFGLLSRNFTQSDVLDWERFEEEVKDELTEEDEKMLPILDWLFYLFKGFEGKPSVREVDSESSGYHLIVEFKSPTRERIRTWVRRKLKKK